MISIAHSFTGAALGAVVAHPLPAMLLGLASHAALDEVPHRDYSQPIHAVVDALASLALLMGAAAWLSERGLGTRLPGFWWGAVAGVLPDLEVAIGYFLHQKQRFPTHNGLLPHPQVRTSLGIWTQVVTVVLDALIFVYL